MANNGIAFTSAFGLADGVQGYSRGCAGCPGNNALYADNKDTLDSRVLSVTILAIVQLGLIFAQLQLYALKSVIDTTVLH